MTIPASFDTVQSNATKEAGYQAGFKQVVLLQEPIAASLAYANKEKGIDLKNSQWIVYDLGGGTFDVALVKIVEGELTVIDHEGDNYLGGGDLDALIVEKILVSELTKRGKFDDLLGQMKSETGKYNRLWTILLRMAEAAKIELTTKTSAEVDLGMVRDLEDDDGNRIDCVISITRSEFESAIRDKIDGTAEMLRRILTRNNLQSSDLKFVLMVGGSTYVPYVRKRIEELLGISVNTGIDPTNAIAIGAAYFAATKEISINGQGKSKPKDPGTLHLKVSYNRASQEKEELFSAKVEGATDNLFYRITSDDGSYDSGLKVLSSRIVEELPLIEDAYNSFSIFVYDDKNNRIPASVENIQIAQGKYSVSGQMLPDDLCLVKDDFSIQDTRLDRIFLKNSVIPSKTKKHVEVGRTIVKGSNEQLRIIVVEGSADHHSSTNKPIGSLVITGEQITRDLLKGTEIDLTFEMSESRDLTVSAYLNGTGQEFSQVFDPKPRAVPVEILSDEIQLLEKTLDDEISEAEENESETVEQLEKLRGRIEQLVGEAAILTIDDVTDDRFKLEDKKRLLAQELFQMTSGKKAEKAKLEYNETKEEVSELVSKSGNDKERHQLEEIFAREYTFLSSANALKIEASTAILERIRWQIFGRTPEFLIGMFQHVVERRASMNDDLQAKSLIDSGKRHIANEEWEQLRDVNGRLFELLPRAEQKADDFRHFTGIV